jgi:DNA-binding transcriptional ArsR family regulator
MTYAPALTALADPTRRAILDQMRTGPRSVAEIAAPLPVSRPAVSQHLKVMLDAGLVTLEQHGTRNLYTLAPVGLEPLHGWLEALRTDARASAARAAETLTADIIPPITKSYDVRLSPAEAFALFTEDLALWWPVARHSLSAAADGGLPMALVFHGGAQGRIEETQISGATGQWASVTDWAPPHGLTLRWTMGRPDAEATRVKVRLDPAGRGTRMTLVHSGWDALGETVRGEYDALWEHVLGTRFTAAAHAALSNF